MILKGFKLPEELAIKKKGVIMDSEELIRKILPNGMTYYKGYKLYLYGTDLIERETEALHSDYEKVLRGELKPDFECSNKYRNDNSEIIEIDLRYLIIIADLGCDIPICLDFRDTSKVKDPPVVVLHDSFVYVEIAPSFSAFWKIVVASS